MQKACCFDMKRIVYLTLWFLFFYWVKNHFKLSENPGLSPLKCRDPDVEVKFLDPWKQPTNKLCNN